MLQLCLGGKGLGMCYSSGERGRIRACYSSGEGRECGGGGSEHAIALSGQRKREEEGETEGGRCGP